jgi:GNAT superfamily N-acetyltransferase
MTEPVVITHLEMRDRAAFVPAPARDGLSARLVDPPDPAFNERMYRTVGGPWQWTDHLGRTASDWASHATQPSLRTYDLVFDREGAGYFEILRHPDASVEIAYFGLLPTFIGRGLGGRALSLCLEAAWEEAPTRVWVHTCTRDHPNALPSYVARGFTRSDRSRGCRRSRGPD